MWKCGKARSNATSNWEGPSWDNLKDAVVERNYKNSSQEYTNNSRPKKVQVQGFAWSSQSVSPMSYTPSLQNLQLQKSLDWPTRKQDLRSHAPSPSSFASLKQESCWSPSPWSAPFASWNQSPTVRFPSHTTFSCGPISSLKAPPEPIDKNHPCSATNPSPIYTWGKTSVLPSQHPAITSSPRDQPSSGLKLPPGFTWQQMTSIPASKREQTPKLPSSDKGSPIAWPESDQLFSWSPLSPASSRNRGSSPDAWFFLSDQDSSSNSMSDQLSSKTKPSAPKVLPSCSSNFNHSSPDVKVPDPKPSTSYEVNDRRYTENLEEYYPRFDPPMSWTNVVINMIETSSEEDDRDINRANMVVDETGPSNKPFRMPKSFQLNEGWGPVSFTNQGIVHLLDKHEECLQILDQKSLITEAARRIQIHGWEPKCLKPYDYV